MSEPCGDEEECHCRSEDDVESVVVSAYDGGYADPDRDDEEDYACEGDVEEQNERHGQRGGYVGAGE